MSNIDKTRLLQAVDKVNGKMSKGNVHVSEVTMRDFLSEFGNKLVAGVSSGPIQHVSLNTGTSKIIFADMNGFGADGPLSS